MLSQIDNKIEMYQKRIDIRKNKPCYFDESDTILKFENRIANLEETKEWICKID